MASQASTRMPTPKSRSRAASSFETPDDSDCDNDDGPEVHLITEEFIGAISFLRVKCCKLCRHSTLANGGII